METIERLRTSDPLNAEWVTLTLLLVLAALAWTNKNSPRKWRLLVQAMSRMRLERQALREEVDLQDRTFLGLLGVSVAVTSLFLWQSTMVLPGGPAPAYPALMGVVAIVLLLQAVLLRLVGWLFDGDGGLAEYLATGLLLFILLAIMLLPITVLTAYRSAWRDELVVAGLVIGGLLLLYRWVRGAWIGLGEGVRPGYIILYLCAAEAVPLLLFIQSLKAPHVHP